MADGGNPIASLYPQPPQISSGNALADPLRMIGMMNALNQNQLFQREFAAKNAQANALQGAIGEDGSFEPSTYANTIKNDPNAAFGMDPASLLQQRGMQIDNATKGFGLMTSQDSEIRNMLAGLAANPKSSKDDFANMVPSLVRKGVPPDMIGPYYSGLSSDPATFRKQVGTFAAIGMGPAAASNRETGQPDPVTGAPTTVPRGTAYMAGSYPTDLPPGQGGALAAGQSAYLADQQKAATSMAALRPLEQALPLIDQLNHYNFGPGSPQLAKIKAGLATFGIVDPNTSDVTLRQEVSKYLNNYTSQARSAGRSDEGLAQAKASTPNLDLTQPANLALIKNQVAMDRMDAAAPTAFNIERGTGMNARAGYLDYKGGYYPKMDLRAFRYDLMPPQERTDLLSSLGVKFDAQGQPTMPAKPSAALKKFQQSYAVARQALNYAGQSANGQ